MAARSHVDSSVNERRLRPIYDCLDNGNNKKALQEADKLLKKQKDFLCAKALKALALVRLGRQEDSYNLIQEVHVEDPIDDPTLQAMTICYRELQKLDLIADAYERATKKDPHNEELLSHLFMSHVRSGDYKKQQQTAMALYKLKAKNPYYFWAVMSIVMQAHVADEKLAKEMLLPLAERMTEKFIKENKLEAEAEAQLYLMILEKQEKFDKAIEVLEGPLHEKIPFYQDTKLERKAGYLVKLQLWPEANQAYKKLILGNPDQWSYYQEYFKTVANLVESNYQPKENVDKNDTIDHTFELAVDFIEALVEEQNGTRDGRKLRGPYLAQIKLLDELLKRSSPVAQKIGTMVDLLTNFYEQFGSKPSCFLDISYAVKSLIIEEESIKKVLENIKQSLVLENGSEAALSKSLRQMNQHLCYSRLCFYYGLYDNLNQEDKLVCVESLIDRYQNGLQFGSDLLSTEFQHSDNYVLLAAHVLISVWEKTGDENLIITIVLLLERSRENSPSNFQIMLLLMKLYHILGAVGGSYSLYKKVDVKHIQQETLGYLITECLPSAAYYSAFNSVLGNSLHFYTSNYKDIVDYLLSGYKFGSFTKIPELVEFREKINNSLQYASCTVEKMILEILLESKSYQDSVRIIRSMEIDPEKDHRPTKDLVDNRDVNVYRMYTEKEKHILDEQVSKSFQEKVLWLRVRNLILRILAASFSLKKPIHENEVHNNISNGEKNHMVDILSDLVASLKECCNSADTNNMINSVLPIQSPGVSRVYKYVRDNHLDTLVALSRLVLSIYQLVEGYSIHPSENKDVCESLNTIKTYFQGSLKKIQATYQKRNELKATEVKEFLEDLSNTTEVFSFSTIFVSICHEMLKPLWVSLMKRGKKKKDTGPQIPPETFQNMTDLISEMELSGCTILDLLKEIDVSQLTCLHVDVKELEKYTFVQNLDLQRLVPEFKDRVEVSYLISIKELKELLWSKVRYLQSLKW